MRKIPTLYRRNPDDMRHMLDEVTPGCEWVLAGEGVATRKYDGTCVMYNGADWWARREVKPGKTPPPGWVEVERDDATGKRVGWEPMAQSPFVKFWREAAAPVEEFGRLLGIEPQPGTYELIGPKINGNPERAESHRLEPHRNAERLDYEDMPLDFEHLGEYVRWLAEDGIEGVVWHHPDGRMAKLKGRDFPATGDPA